MIEEENLDWSFSGLKTAVLREIKKLEDRNWMLDKEAGSLKESNIKHQYPASGFSLPTSKLAAEIQEAIVDSLVTKTIRAIQTYKPKSFLLAGGVAANLRLREKFADEIRSKKLNCSFHVPDTKLCTDNATYIAAYAHFCPKPVDWQKISANPELTITD